MITQCPFCKNKKTRYIYTTICPIYSCKCGASMDVLFDAEETSKSGITTYNRVWVKR